MGRDLYFMQPGRVLIPSPSLFPQLSPKPARLFNVFKHSRIISSTFSRVFISWSLILLFPLQHLTQICKHSSRDCVNLLVNHTRDLVSLSCQTHVFTFGAPTFFLHVANQTCHRDGLAFFLELRLIFPSFFRDLSIFFQPFDLRFPDRQLFSDLPHLLVINSFKLFLSVLRFVCLIGPCFFHPFTNKNAQTTE